MPRIFQTPSRITQPRDVLKFKGRLTKGDRDALQVPSIRNHTVISVLLPGKSEEM